MRKKTGGRKTGSINKSIAPIKTVREVWINVFHSLQADPEADLFWFAKMYPKEFYALASKLIPVELTGAGGQDLFKAFNNVDVDKV